MRCVLLLLASLCWAPIALAQEQAPPRDTYVACQAAANGGDRRIDEICDLVDEIHSRLRTRDSSRHPRHHADLQHALGTALFAIGDLGDERALRDAIAAEEIAAQYFNRRRTPTRWAAIQLQTAGALNTLADLGDAEAAQQAIDALTPAIEAVRRGEQPDLWASLQTTLASAYALRYRTSADRNDLQSAIGALQAALEVYRRPRFAERRARTEARLEELIRALGGEQDDS